MVQTCKKVEPETPCRLRDESYVVERYHEWIEVSYSLIEYISGEDEATHDDGHVCSKSWVHEVEDISQNPADKSTPVKTKEKGFLLRHAVNLLVEVDCIIIN